MFPSIFRSYLPVFVLSFIPLPFLLPAPAPVSIKKNENENDKGIFLSFPSVFMLWQWQDEGYGGAGDWERLFFCVRRRRLLLPAAAAGGERRGQLTPRPHGSKTAFMRALFCVCA